MAAQLRDPSINKIDVEGRAVGEIQCLDEFDLLLRFQGGGASAFGADGVERIAEF
jgi:hypothetical protein